MSEGKIKIGLLTFSLPSERIDLAKKFGKDAATSLQSLGFELIESDGLIYTSDESITAAAKHADMGASCVIMALGSWMFTPAVVDAVRKIDLPFAIWAEDNPASFSLTAGGIVHGSLDELGLKHRFFYGSLHSEELLKEIAAFIRACGAAKDLKEDKLCVIGGRVKGMYTTMADMIQIKNVFGLEIEHIDTLRVYLEAKKVPIQKVSETIKWLGEEFGRINVDQKFVEKSARLYIALKDILTKTGYNIAAIKCQDELINNYSSCCLPISLLNDDGFTVSCESDIYAAITMRILSLVSGGVSLFGDINHLDQKERVLRIVNCGTMPSLMADNRKDVDLELQYEYMGQARGITTAFCVRESPMTVARLCRIKGKFVLFAAEGHTQKVEKERFKETREAWPHVFVKLSCDMKKLIQSFRSNHVHACFGNHLDDLKEFCSLKDIEILIP
ncbi:MAG: hypothetical protein ABIG61_03100 [Planctomycetota bacterium]